MGFLADQHHTTVEPLLAKRGCRGATGHVGSDDEEGRHGLVERDEQLAVLLAHLEHVDGLGGRTVHHLAGGDVELAPMAGALDHQALEVPLGQGALPVRTDVIERVQVAADVRDGHHPVPDGNGGHLAIADLAGLDLRPIRHVPVLLQTSSNACRLPPTFAMATIRSPTGTAVISPSPISPASTFAQSAMYRFSFPSRSVCGPRTREPQHRARAAEGRTATGASRVGSRSFAGQGGPESGIPGRPPRTCRTG